MMLTAKQLRKSVDQYYKEKFSVTTDKTQPKDSFKITMSTVTPEIVDNLKQNLLSEGLKAKTFAMYVIVEKMSDNYMPKFIKESVPVEQPVKKSTRRKHGVYETTYGNAAEWDGGKTGYDLDSGNNIHISMIDFSKYLRPLD